MGDGKEKAYVEEDGLCVIECPEHMRELIAWASLKDSIPVDFTAVKMKTKWDHTHDTTSDPISSSKARVPSTDPPEQGWRMPPPLVRRSHRLFGCLTRTWSTVGWLSPPITGCESTRP